MPEESPTQDPEGPQKPGVASSEFWISIILVLGAVAGGIILLVQGKTQDGVNLFITAAGSGGVYTAARSFVKR